MIKTFQDIKITQRMLKQVSKISFFRERFSNLPLERKWIEQLTEQATFSAVAGSLLLEGEEVNANDIDDIHQMKNDVLRQRFLNELELRKSFPVYFNTSEFNIEQINYIHRFLDNVNDKLAKERGKYRRGQTTREIENFEKLSQSLPRYGFLPRLLEEFVGLINESEMEEIILSGLIYAEFIEISPFNRANAQVARILSKGFLFTRGFDPFQILNTDQFFLERKSKYYNSLGKYFEGDPVRWIELYLQAIIDSFKKASYEIEQISGRTIRPLSNEIIHITDRQKTIVELLKKNSQMSGSEIATILGVSRQNIFVIMQKLLRKKVVDKVGKGTTSRYRLKGN